MFFLVYLIASIGSIIYSFVIFDKIYVSKKLSLIWKIVFTVAVSLGKAVIDSQSKMTIDMSIIKFSYTFIALIVLNLIFYKPPGKIFIIYDAIYHITTGIVEMLSARKAASLTREEIAAALRDAAEGPEPAGQAFPKPVLVLGADTVTIGVYESNGPARHCYRKAGFTERETVKREPWNLIEMEIGRAGYQALQGL